MAIGTADELALRMDDSEIQRASVRVVGIPDPLVEASRLDFRTWKILVYGSADFRARLALRLVGACRTSGRCGQCINRGAMWHDKRLAAELISSCPAGRKDLLECAWTNASANYVGAVLEAVTDEAAQTARRLASPSPEWGATTDEDGIWRPGQDFYAQRNYEQ